VLDRHVEGNFPEQVYRRAFAAAGLDTRVVHDKWNRHVFIARKPVAPQAP
jgi:hypothetical protein